MYYRAFCGFVCTTVLTVCLQGCGATTAIPAKHASAAAHVNRMAGAIEFGTGIDKSTGMLTGQGTTFTLGDAVTFLAHLAARPGANVQLTINKVEGMTEQVVGSRVLATPSPDNREIFDTLLTSAFMFSAGKYSVRVLHADQQLAEGTFQLTPPSSNSAAAASFGQNDAPGVTTAVDAYRLALHDVYGPAYSVSMLGEVASGQAEQAVLCSLQGKSDSLINTRSYITYGNVSDEFQPVQFDGTTATVADHIQQRITTHHADGTEAGYDADYTMTFTLVNDGLTWKVVDYSWVGSDGSTGGAAQDVRPCQ